MAVDRESLKRLKAPALALLITSLVLLGYYSFAVQGKASYEASRSFRLLSALGGQINASVRNPATVIDRLFNDLSKRRVTIREKEEAAKAWLPGLQSLRDKGTVSASDCHQQEKGYAYWEREGRTDWLRISRCQSNTRYLGELRLDKLLAPDFDQALNRGVFDKILLVTPDGNVVMQAGIPELQLRRLDKLLESAGGVEQQVAPFASLAQSTNAVEVELSGTKYRLFIQPLSLVMGSGDPVGGTPRAGHQWVLCGLVSRQKLIYRSLAFSPSVVALIAGAILIAVFSWPFLKLRLIGAHQRVGAIDVWLVALCGLIGVALLTLFGLDLPAYARLKGEINGQLQEFSQKLQDNMAEEVELALKQLYQLEDVALKSPPSGNPWKGTKVSPGYHFREFYLIDSKGEQKRKWSFAEVTDQENIPEPERATPFIKVNDRQYFKDATRLADAPGVYALESVRSWTRGEERMVIAKAIGHGRSSDLATGKELCSETGRTADEHLPVAALAAPMRSLIRPVIVPGFEFAIIDAEGTVLFHSDPKRNLVENFIVEADRSSELRSALAGLRAEAMPLSYEGRDFLSYVTPIRCLPQAQWFMITLYDQGRLRTFNIEVLITALQFLAIYGGLYLVVGLACALAHPQYRAVWLWPDQKRLPRYRLLIKSYLLLMVLFGALIFGAQKNSLLLVSWLFPFGVWAVTYTVLRRIPRIEAGNPPKSPGRFGFVAPYTVMLTLLWLLVSVLPAVAFFKVACWHHTDTYLKHAQLKVAQALAGRERRESARPAAGSERMAKTEKLETYLGFFFESERLNLQTEGGRPAGICGWPLKSLVAGLPLYSEFSVERGGLYDDQTADGRWRWTVVGTDRLVLSGETNGAKPTVIASKHPQMLMLGTAGPHVRYFAWLLLTACLLLLVLYAAVQFVTRRVFLIDLPEPLQVVNDSKIRTGKGQHLFLLCRQDHPFAIPTQKAVLDFKEQLFRDSTDGRWRKQLGAVLDRTELGDVVVVKHFDYRIYDLSLSEVKLAVLGELLNVHHRTVVVTSRADPRSLFSHAEFQEGAGAGGEAPRRQERWRHLLSSFIVLDVERLLIETNAQGGAGHAATNGHKGWQRIDLECGNDPFLQRVLPDLKRIAAGSPDLGQDQLIEELSDRSANYHHGLWHSCTPQEKLVLLHLAETGFVNWKDRQTIRRLMGRGLIKRDPHFTFVSGTFRRFVLSTACRRDITPAEALLSGTWDSVRGPFTFTLMASVAFFYVTQQELLNFTTAIITGATGSLPVIVKLMDHLTAKNPAAEKSA